jgi:hypothetical protein
MPASKYRRFYEKMFGNDFRVESAEDVARCIAYSLYQMHKKQFAEANAIDLHSPQISDWSNAQTVDLYLEEAKRNLQDVMSSRKFSNFYEELFGEGFRIETAHDIAKCIAYAHYQARKKQFLEMQEIDLYSREIKTWSEGQSPEMHMRNAEQHLERIIQKAANEEASKQFINKTSQAMEELKNQFNKATGIWQTALQGTLGTFIAAFILLLLSMGIKIGVPHMNYLFDKVQVVLASMIDIPPPESAVSQPAP